MCDSRRPENGADSETLWSEPRQTYQAIPLERRLYLTEAGKLPLSCKTPVGRFVEKVDASGDCWEWTSTITTHGYGWFHLSINRTRKAVSAHRFMYGLLVGPVPNGLQLDHLCRNRRCVNPDHLEAVTHKENVRRGMAPGSIRWRQRRAGLA